MNIPDQVQEQFVRWATRRQKRTRDQITLDRKRIFILPTRNGMWFGLMLIAMLAGSIHYSNSLAFMLTFLLAGLMGTGMWQTQRNLLGIRIKALTPGDAFNGQPISLPLELQAPNRDTGHCIVMQWRDEAITMHDILPGITTQAAAIIRPGHRGWFEPGRFRIYSRFPLGLFQAWSWLEFDRPVLVYPKPVQTPLPDRSSGDFGNDSKGRQSGAEDFAGLMDYRPGDALGRIAWKTIASEQQPQTKQFHSGSAEELWLDWNTLSDRDPELRLSRLCAQVLEADHLQLDYGLRLPGLELAPNHGGGHRQACLKALALYE